MSINNNTQYKVNRKQVHQLMKVAGINCSIHVNTLSQKELMSTNLIKYYFKQARSNLVWTTNCTELKYGNQNTHKLRLSTIKHLHDHMHHCHSLYTEKSFTFKNPLAEVN